MTFEKGKLKQPTKNHKKTRYNSLNSTPDSSRNFSHFESQSSTEESIESNFFNVSTSVKRKENEHSSESDADESEKESIENVSKKPKYQFDKDYYQTKEDLDESFIDAGAETDVESDTESISVKEV